MSNVTMAFQHLPGHSDEGGSSLFKRGAGLTNCQIQVTMFVDNTVLLAESEDGLKWNVEKLHEAVKRYKLKVN